MVSEGSETLLKPTWWFQRGLKLTVFLKKRLRNGSMIRFESYGGSKLDEIGPDDLFCYTRPLQGHPAASSDGFRGVSEGSETRLFLKKAPKWLYDSFWIIRQLEIGWNRPRRPVLLHTAPQAIPRRPVMVSKGFQRGLKLSLCFKRRLRNGCMIRFKSYGGSNLDEIGPDDLLCYIRPLQGYPEASSDGFRGVSQGSETAWFQRGFRTVWNRVVSEGFQRGLKPCDFRGVSEGSETAWFQRGFKGVWNRVVSEGFQRGLKPCGFRGVSEGFETVWFQRGFRGVWNRVVSEGFPRGLKPFGLEGFQRGLKPFGFRGVSEGSETVWVQRGFRGVWNRVVSEGSENFLF